MEQRQVGVPPKQSSGVGGEVGDVRDRSIDPGANLRSVMDSLGDGVLVLGSSGDVVFANRVAESMLARPSSELIGEPLEIPISSGDQAGHVEMRVVITAWDGEPASLIHLHDATRRRRSEQELAYRATHDPLTRLPNRYLFDDRLRQVLARAERVPGAVCIFYCDLDHLKTINDRYGHRIGDAAIVETARRLARVIRPSDTAAHLSGDEFVILCEGVDVSQARSLVNRLALAFQDPMHIDGLDLRVSLSVGFALSRDPRIDPASFLDEADQAMYEAKSRHRQAQHGELPVFRDQ
jgi:diguanylate cyclase (GGDEF)-like protein